MPLAGDFRVVNDAPHKLVAGQEATFTCDIPPHIDRADASLKSVILVKFSLEGASALTWELSLNGSLLLTFSGSGSDLITTIEAFDSHLLLAGENQVRIRATHGLGAVKIADTVVHYHVHL
jgi:hypothetical protein